MIQYGDLMPAYERPRIYRISRHSISPLRYSLDRLNEKGRVIHHVGEHFVSVEDAKSMAQMAKATEIIIAPELEIIDPDETFEWVHGRFGVGA